MGVDDADERKTQPVFCHKREFSPDSHRIISAKLKRRLEPRYISNRAGPRGGYRGPFCIALDPDGF